MKSVLAPNEPVPVPRRMETEVEPWFATAKSKLPSLLKSAVATADGLVAVVKSVLAPKMPVPVPSKIETDVEPELATAKSGKPSLLKSPDVTD